MKKYWRFRSFQSYASGLSHNASLNIAEVYFPCMFQSSDYFQAKIWKWSAQPTFPSSQPISLVSFNFKNKLSLECLTKYQKTLWAPPTHSGTDDAGMSYLVYWKISYFPLENITWAVSPVGPCAVRTAVSCFRISLSNLHELGNAMIYVFFPKGRELFLAMGNVQPV